jgi:hypothetical protein
VAVRTNCPTQVGAHIPTLTLYLNTSQHPTRYSWTEDLPLIIRVWGNTPIVASIREAALYLGLEVEDSPAPEAVAKMCGVCLRYAQMCYIVR